MRREEAGWVPPESGRSRFISVAGRGGWAVSRWQASNSTHWEISSTRYARPIRDREKERERGREREGERLATVVQNAVEWSRGDILDGFQALGSIKGV